MTGWLGQPVRRRLPIWPPAWPSAPTQSSASSGHPPLRMETMATARFYRDSAGLIAFLPAVLGEGTFLPRRIDPDSSGDTVIWWNCACSSATGAIGQPLPGPCPVAAGPFQRDPGHPSPRHALATAA